MNCVRNYRNNWKQYVRSMEDNRKPKENYSVQAKGEEKFQKTTE
jgi:hypothetical protein